MCLKLLSTLFHGVVGLAWKPGKSPKMRTFCKKKDPTPQHILDKRVKGGPALSSVLHLPGTRHRRLGRGGKGVSLPSAAYRRQIR